MSLANESDSDLVGLIACGERAAFARLYDRYAPCLLAIGLRILRDRKEAEDVLHDVFLEVWRAPSEYSDRRGTLRTWLGVKMRSRSIDRLRSAGRSRVVPLETMAEAQQIGETEDPSVTAERGVVRHALASLPVDQRQVIELGYFEGLSASEIAAKLAVPIGTVKSRVAAALAKLRGLVRGGENETREWP